MPRNRRRTRAMLEPLEPRQLLSAAFLNAIGFGTTGNYGTSITDMATDSAGNIVVAGYFQGTMDVDPTSGVHNIISTGSYNYDMYIMKYSPAGDLLWAKTIDSPSTEMTAGIMIDSADNILITGSFSGTVDMDPGPGVFNLTSVGGSDALIAKYDTNGNFIWAKSFGGSGDDTSAKIVSDRKADGGYIITGNFQNTADLDPGTGSTTATASTLWDVYVSHIDANGNLIWSDQFTAPNTLMFNNIAVDNSGDVYAAGCFQGACDFNPGPGTKILGASSGWPPMFGFAAKFSPAGKLDWVKQFGDGADGVITADFTLDAQNNMIIVGSFGGTGDFDPGPRVHDLVEHQSPDAFTGFILKLSSAGAYKWSGALTGDWWSDVYAVKTDSAGNVYVSGEYNGTHAFDIHGNTGPAGDTFTAIGQDDAFLAKYDAAGRLNWVQTMGSDGYDHALHVALGPGHTVYASGYFNNTAHFGPQSGGTDLTAIGNEDSFIAMFDQTPAVTSVQLTAVLVPGRLARSEIFTATLTAPQGIATGKLILMENGKAVGTATLSAQGVATIRLSHLKSGPHTFTVMYAGDPNFAPATSDPLHLTVT